MKTTLIGGSLFLIVLFFSCKHDTPLQQPGTGTTPGSGNPTGNGSGGSSVPPVVCSPDTAYFQQQVLPIFISNCSFSGCHDEISRQDGIVLTNYTGIRRKVRPGNLSDSEIWEKITENDPSDRMPPPPRPALTAMQKDLIRKWILQGARDNSCQATICDTASVTYTTNIRSIISNKCQGCHSGTAPAAGYDFSQYTILKARVTDGKLWGAINHLPGYSPMPQNGSKLSECEITQVRKWIDAGAPNN